MGILRARLELASPVACIHLRHRHLGLDPGKAESGLATPEAGAGPEPGHAHILDPTGGGRVPDVRLCPLLPSATKPLVGAEASRIERRHHIGPVPETTPHLTVHAGTRLEPGTRHDDGVDERPLDAVIHRRLVPLIDDADRHQEHPGAEVQLAGDEKVDVGLFELELPCLFEPLDKGMLQLELGDEPDPVREAVREQQDEPMKIEPGVLMLDIVEVEVHVPRDRAR